MLVHSGLRVRAGLRRGHSSRGPIPSRMMGSSVAETAMLISGISSPASPMLRRKGTGGEGEGGQAYRDRDAGEQH
jgi:hypothetical protein